MNCCTDFGNCDQGRNCPVRQARQGMAVPEDDPTPLHEDDDIITFETVLVGFVIFLAVAIALFCAGSLAGFIYARFF